MVILLCCKFMAIFCLRLVTVSGISVDEAALFFSIFKIGLEVNSQMNTEKISAWNSILGVA